MTAAAGQSTLFLSCDLTGSTHFKQQASARDRDPWQKVFLQFYREFPQELRSAQTRQKTTNLTFHLWKPVGDELIFTCDVSREQDIHDAIITWLDAMAGYSTNSLDDTTLGTKGGAFIATFPGPDSMSTIPRNPGSETSGKDVVMLNQEALRGHRRHTKFLYDYFGPSIDTGFRVFSKCDERYFTMSVEVSFALACFEKTPGPQAEYRLPPMRLLHSDGLKGVWRNQRYPVFALDLEHDSPVHKAFAPFDDPATALEQIHELCEACYTSPQWPFKLYLPESGNGHFTGKPIDPLQGYLDRLEYEDRGESPPEDDGVVTVPVDELPTAQSSSPAVGSGAIAVQESSPE
ncbi:hypothetical protein [Aeromicrobium sp. CnD17-E]|uniref:hypothetical protein n=1 Tax=Aeromicrobium sp. CnD17-E TaxID=2954487 RepID=UPI0020985068|nr:hypothetical protein [Aeromicrobium sp. CnD17-E]MCO7238394.1 hypothetical protein [Aeromicrobium sp. CnD17-E]